MNEIILTLNAGSSSVKFALFEAGESEPELVAKGQVEGIGTAPHFVAKDTTGALLAESYWEPVGGGAGHTVAFRQIWRWLSEAIEGKRLLAVGHRVAHGGEQHAQPVIIDEQVPRKSSSNPWIIRATSGRSKSYSASCRVSTATIPRTRPPASAAALRDTGPPIECPTRTTRSRSRYSIRPATSRP